jgi:uncharacterized protein
MEFVATREELRTIYKTPRPTDGSVRKELTVLDGHCRSFIGKSPFVLIGSSDCAGNADVTPKGDRPGFAVVLTRRPSPSPTGPATTGWTRWKTSFSTRRSGCSSSFRA